MGDALTTILLLAKPAKLTSDALEREIRRVAGAFVQSLEFPKDGKEPVLFELNGLQVAVLNLDAPAPGFSDYQSDGPNLLWPSVEADLARHKAHIMVGCPEVEGREGNIAHASVLTFVAAAILKLTETIGVYWPAGENFVTAETFLNAAEGFGRGEGPPVMAWVRLYAAEADGGIVLSTRGLRPFTGRELDFAPSKLHLGELMQNALSIAHYLVASGSEFRDGETIGPGEAASFTITLQDNGRMKTGPVYALAAPKASAGREN